MLIKWVPFRYKHCSSQKYTYKLYCLIFFQFIAVARKRSHERRSDKEKTSLKRLKDFTLEKASRKDQDADASGKREMKAKGDEEGTADLHCYCLTGC